MRVANISGRAAIVRDDGAVDIAAASGGRFGPDPSELLDEWASFSEWAASVEAPSAPYDLAALEAPSPRPRQVFAVGANYRDHVEEAGAAIPTTPVVFTKFPHCIVGPNVDVALRSGDVDWEAELVIVVGVGGHRIPVERAWRHIAGLTIGQDLSDRVLQLNYERPQFSLAKSFPGFGPTGPWMVTPDELPDRDDIAIRCTLNGVTRQDFRTDKLIFTVPQIIAELSDIVTFYPGDIIFTGTSGGVGMLQDPPEFLKPGDELVTSIVGIGSITTRLVSA